jgi:hypothetical protein
MTKTAKISEPKQKDAHPNASVHVEDKPQFDERPEKYPAAKKGLGNPDKPADR